MGIAAVTILILSMMILALTTGASILGVWIWKLRRELSRSESSFRQVSEEYEKELSINADLEAANTRLRTQATQIPLTPRPKETNNGVQQAKNSGDVRRLTEKAWGTNPNDRN
jgi:hypothetical protein